jgi:hypothetical protein
MAAHHLAWGVKKWGAARAFSIDVMGRSSWPTSSMVCILSLKATASALSLCIRLG